MTTPDISKYLIKQTPDINKYLEHPEVVNDDPNEGILSTIGNAFSYVKNALTKDQFNEKLQAYAKANPNASLLDAARMQQEYNRDRWQQDKDTGNLLVKNIGKFVVGSNDQNGNFQLGTVPQFFKDVLTSWTPNQVEQSPSGQQVISAISKANNSSVGDLASGTIKGVAGMITTPISILTSTVNENGEAVPATPDQQAQNIQKGLAIALQTLTATKVIGALAPETLAGEAALAPSKIGLLGKSIGAQVIGQGAGGLAGGLIGEMGSGHEIESGLGNALAFAPLGVIFGTLHANGLIAGAGAERSKFLNNDEPAQELAAFKGLQITEKSSPADIISNIDAFSNSDKLATALVKARLNVGSGTIIPGLSEERFNALQEELKPSDRSTEGVYFPSEQVAKKLNMMRPNIGGINQLTVNFKDPFDKAAYFAGGSSKSAKMIMDDLTSQTGLSQSEIMSHRSTIKDYMKQQVQSGNISQLTPEQAAIVTQNGGKVPIPSIEVPKQNFNPQNGRTPYEFNVYKSGDNTLITPWKLNQPTEDFFGRTGYMPNEIVTVSGNEGVVRGFQDGKIYTEDLQTGDKTYSDPSDVTRTSNSISSEIYKDRNGNQIGRAGILNRENYFNNLYDRFKQTFVMNEPPKGSYEDNILDFARKIGMDNKGDIEQLQKAFYVKLRDDAISGDTQLENRVKAVQQNLLDWNKRFRSELGTQLHQQSLTNGMYVVPEGSGVYNIKDINSGKILQSVTSAEDALDFINKSGQTNAFDLDGGNTNGTPTATANLGSSANPYTIVNPASAKWWDTKVNTGRFATSLVPVGKELAAQDATAGTQFKQHFDAMQMAQGILKAKIQDPKAFKPLEEKFNSIVESAKGIPKDRLGYISDWMESMSIPEIVKGLLSRPMNSFELAKAGDLSKLDVDAVTNYMYDVRSNVSGTIGSKEFKAKQAEIAAKTIKGIPLYDPEIVKAGNDLFNLTTQPQDAVSPFGIIRLAKALKNPDAALSRTEYAARMNLTLDEITVGNKLDDLFKNGGDRFGINNASLITGYLPHTKIAVATGFNPWASAKTNVDFASSMSRMGIMPNDILQRDPLLLARNYIYSGTRTAKIIPEAAAYLGSTGSNMLSFNDIVKRAQDYNATLMDKPDLAPFSNVFNEHIMDVKGIPDLSDQLGRAAQKQLEMMFGPSDSSGGSLTKATVLLVHSAFLGGRLSLTLRDVMNAATNSFGLYGADFTRKMLSNNISKEYAIGVQNKGIIPKQNGLDLLMPGENISAGLDRLSRIANTTMKYNGNQLIHTQLSAKIFKTTYEQVGDLSQKMLKNEVSKQKAYTELKIQQLDPATQAQFDNLISDGKTDQAAELLGRYRVKQIVNIYGNANNPVNWNTAFGRVAGGFMSWGVNQAQTMADAALRGTVRQRIGALARYGVANGAILGAGYYTGINLSGWMINPFQLVSTSPLLSLATEGMKALGGMSSTNVNQRQQSEQAIMNWIPHNEKTLAHAYLPYSYMVQDWVTGINELNNDFGPSGAAKVMGIPTNNSTRSPMQQDLGLFPKVGGKSLPNNNQTAIEKTVMK